MAHGSDFYTVVDVGNTRVKIAVYQNDVLLDLQVFNVSDMDEIKCNDLKKLEQVIFSSVTNDEINQKLIDKIQPKLIMSSNINLPIALSAYQTPHTLGVDRIANAVAVNYLKNTTYGLAIDLGTCIKYDLVHSDYGFLGGAISPGLKMRFKAMHHFTGKLPLIEPGNPNWLGTSSNECMQSGVVNGIINELNGFIDQYYQQYQHLTIFLTGGDAKRFDKALKNSIFVDENLTLFGLYLILKYNA